MSCIDWYASIGNTAIAAKHAAQIRTNRESWAASGAGRTCSRKPIAYARSHAPQHAKLANPSQLRVVLAV